MNVLKIATLLVMFFLGQVAYCNERYEPYSAVLDHQSDGVLDFLIGSWEPVDKGVNFTECWTRSHSGMLVGFRTFDKPGYEYDLFSFEPSRGCSILRMRRAEFHMRNLEPASLSGGWSSETRNRATLSFESETPKFKLISKYQSPSDGLLDVEIERYSDKGVDKTVLHLTKVK